MTAKRALDIVVSASALLVLSPLMAAVALAVCGQDGGAPLFRQERVGKGGRTFVLLKFRSMRAGAERSGPHVTAAGDPRITSVGRFLRRFKLDELPQLYNVLRGDMSLVGPRPEVGTYVALYTAAQRAVLELIPGITDPASIAFRDEETLLAGQPDPEQYYVDVVMPRKVGMNLEYASRATLHSDLRILAETVRALVRRT